MRTTFKLKVILQCLVLLSLCQTVNAQKKWKKYLFTGSSQLVSGMLDGTIESISYHYENGFKPRFQNANDKFWNPALSWKNKYKDGNCELGPRFAGSTTMFVWSTDAYHLLRTSKRAVDGLTLAYYMNKECKNQGKEFYDGKHAKKKWKSVAKDFIALTAVRCIGFHLTYSVLFKVQPNFDHK